MKYPLATVEKLMNTLGDRLGGGYDIGCKFTATLKSSLIHELANTLHYRSLVGAFHGHAHNRLCQITNLAMYVFGMGLEDLEGCERAFSKSNALARGTRYSSVFHRQQTIASYFEHNDNYDVYANLSMFPLNVTSNLLSDLTTGTFLLNNYKQALHIIATAPAIIQEGMKEVGVTHESEMDCWLQEEGDYLVALKKEPELDSMEIEYYARLVELEASRYVSLCICELFCS